ncbi:MAG: hypothetical protein JO033_05965 [Acidobacteriaceae bacterium]|nr:hypothetical protein [Acidobacteriaceae bacterium]MBV9502814.1 hypothetical protein [Acidobacteriaceae bacterium]
MRYDAVFSVEGKRVKYDSNPMLRRPGYNAPEGAYTVQDRYGLWLCKVFIPIQRKNEWITTKGSEFTKLHAFFNCQALRLYGESRICREYTDRDLAGRGTCYPANL